MPSMALNPFIFKGSVFFGLYFLCTVYNVVQIRTPVFAAFPAT